LDVSFISSSDKVVVLPYGNPAYRLIKNYAPGELNFYYANANKRLSSFLARPVVSDKLGKYSKGSLKSSNSLRIDYAENRRALTTLSRVVDAPELITLRLQLARLLNPDLNPEFRARLLKSAEKEVIRSDRKLKVVSGRYRLTSAAVKLPITFDSSNVNYVLADFGGNASSIVTDPTNSLNKVVKVIKTNS
jgi:hypothetical protein